MIRNFFVIFFTKNRHLNLLFIILHIYGGNFSHSKKLSHNILQSNQLKIFKDYRSEKNNRFYYLRRLLEYKGEPYYYA